MKSALLAIALAVPSPRTLPPAMLHAVAREEPDADATKRAAEAFAAGESAYEAERWDEAVERFEEAQELAPHPFTEYNLGLARARAGRTLEAWHTFEHLAEHAEEVQHREEARSQQAQLRDEIAMIRVDARAGAVACLDGEALALGETAVVLPGAHRLQVDTHDEQLDLRGGETRHLEVRTDAMTKPSRAIRPLLGIAIGAGALSLATGLGTLGTNDRGADIGLAATAGTAAAIALGTTIAALVLHARPRAASPSAPPCAHSASTARSSSTGGGSSGSIDPLPQPP